MNTKKTLRVPVAADGRVLEPQPLEKTREVPARKNQAAKDDDPSSESHGAPEEIVDSEITVPVHSSIESTLTFELLRRESTREDAQDTEDAEHAEDDDGDKGEP